MVSFALNTPLTIMSDTVCLTIDWREADGSLPDSQQEARTQAMFRDLRSLDTIEMVERVPDRSLPEGAMGAQWLWSVLTAEISGASLRKACADVFTRFSDQPLELTVEVDGQSQKIDAKNVRPDDFDAVIDKLVDAAQRLKSVP